VAFLFFNTKKKNLLLKEIGNYCGMKILLEENYLAKFTDKLED